MDINTIYQIEPSLRDIVEYCKENREKDFNKKLQIYEIAKEKAKHHIGNGAVNIRLRSKEAYGCFLRTIIDVLRI